MWKCFSPPRRLWVRLALAGVLLVAGWVGATHVNPDDFSFIPDQGWGDWSGVITGRIIDENGRPVPNAAVRVWGKDIRTTADRNGFFTVRGLQQGGHYSLIVNARGYEDALLRWIPIPRFQSADIGDYHLDEEIFETNYWSVVSNLVNETEWIMSSNMVDIIGPVTNIYTVYEWSVLVSTGATEATESAVPEQPLLDERPELSPTNAPTAPPTTREE